MSSGTDPAVSRDIANRFGKNLLRERERAGYSQEELSFRASLHRTEVGMVERGIRLPRIDTLVKLAGAIECDAADLLEGLEWSPSIPRQGEFRMSGE